MSPDRRLPHEAPRDRAPTALAHLDSVPHPSHHCNTATVYLTAASTLQLCNTGRVPKTTIDAALLYSALDAARQERQWSWRKLASEIGVSPSLLSRLGNGLKPDTDGFATIVRWLRLPAEQFFAGDRDADAEESAAPDLMAQLAPLLRARKELSETDVRYLEQVIGATVERARAQG